LLPTFLRSVAKHFFVNIFRNVAYIFSRQHFSGPTFFNHHFKEMLVSSTIFCHHFTKCCNIFSATFLVIFCQYFTKCRNIFRSNIFSIITFKRCYNIFRKC
jgi:hypothetical protein